MKGKLYNLLGRNNIDILEFEEVMYRYFILSIFEDIVIYMKLDNNRLKLIRKLRNTKEKSSVIKELIKEITGILLEDKEIEEITRLTLAAINKNDTRECVKMEVKESLLILQEFRCPICNKEITRQNSHYDHIIPWSWVGDQLENNYQMLCANCNYYKKASIIYGIKVFLKHRNK